MIEVWTRVLLYSVMPIIAGAVFILGTPGRTWPMYRSEVLLAFVFGLGVAGSGIASFFSHFFMADVVAESIGWEAGSPFQLEIAFANLAIGALGLVAVGRRDGFREATVIAATVFSVGATVVHIVDIAQTGNLAPGNTIQNFANLIRPGLLVGLLVWSRRTSKTVAHSAGGGEDASGLEWESRLGMTVGIITAIAATGFALGYAVGLTLLLTAVSAAVALAVAFSLARTIPRTVANRSTR